MMTEEQRIQILIADDDPVVRHLLGSALQAAGFSTTAVESGKECLERFEDAEGTTFSLLFLDIQLIDMSGYDVLDFLKQKESCKSLPIILLSAHSRDEVMKGCEKAKLADGFLSKPFTMDAAIALVHSLIQ